MHNNTKLFNDLNKFFASNLDDRHLDYLHGRSISAASINKFQIGRFPKLSLLFDHFDPVELREASIVFNATRARFSNHTLTFPVKDFMGNVIAIVGRTLATEAERKVEGFPKYMHTPYEKTKNLYNLDLAIPHVRDKDYVFVVEGQMDVIMADQAGIHNIVGLGNSNLSVNQVLSLSKYCSKVIMIPDNDDAGTEGMSKLSRYLPWNYGIQIFYARLPGKYHDAGEYFQTQTDKDFLLHVKNSIRRVE